MPTLFPVNCETTKLFSVKRDLEPPLPPLLWLPHFPLFTLYKMEVADDASDLYVSDSSESSTSDEEKLEDGFEVNPVISPLFTESPRIKGF